MAMKQQKQHQKQQQQQQPKQQQPANKDSISRVCIKNIPPSCTESSLRSHLTTTSSSLSSVLITDCKILRTKDGKSRKLAFVGFKSPSVSTVHVLPRLISRDVMLCDVC